MNLNVSYKVIIRKVCSSNRWERIYWYTAEHSVEKDSKLDIPIKSPLSELRESYRTGGKPVRARGAGNSRRTRSYESLTKVHVISLRVKQQTRAYRVCASTSAYVLQLLVPYFYETPDYENECGPDSSAWYWDFLSSCCVALILIFLHITIFYGDILRCYLSEASFFFLM